MEVEAIVEQIGCYDRMKRWWLMDNDLPVEVFSTTNLSEADFVKNLLSDRGIRAVITDDVVLRGGAQPPRARVCVASRDQAVANSIVNEWSPASTGH